ncbi:MAG: 3-hydroxy-3-methylglutaryl-CoA reductase, partial [Chloroflexi bacterium]|nr:3-hydroxy-3-methylglutaryl-CoA reductase [Chloroflexota bacterium]
MIDSADRTSRLPGFYDKSLRERAATIAEWAGLAAEQIAALDGTGGLSPDQADHMIENVVGTHALPLGVATNFLINGREVLVPMAIEEPSVVAGASFMAKLARAPSASLQGSTNGGGFFAHATEPQMIGQMQILDTADPASARLALLENKARILELANQIDPVIVKFGGGARDLEVRVISESAIGPFLVAHLIYDTRDAMGANAVNTACESLAPTIEQITGGRVHLRILSNLADRRLARARCAIAPASLAFGEFTGENVRDRIIEAWAFAAA